MLEKEYEFYLENKAELITKYLDKFIVIVHNKLIGSYSSREEAIKETIKEHKLGTFLVHQVLKEEPIARFYSRVY